MNEPGATGLLAGIPPARKTQHFLGVQVLRGLAAVLVVIHHATQNGTRLPGKPTFSWLDHGSFGVDIFFPISGFVIYLSTTIMMRKSSGNMIGKFVERRLIRIVPLYWIFTTLTLVLFEVAPNTMLSYKATAWNVVASYFFLFSYNNVGSPEPVLPVGWTLNYEMLFYAIVLFVIATRRSLLKVCTVIILLFALAGCFIPHRYAIAYALDPIELEFLAGMYLAAYAHWLKKIPAWISLVAAAICFSFVLCGPFAAPEFQVTRPLIYGVPGALIVAAFVALEGQIEFGRWRALLLLGDASFALYLSHTFVVPAIAGVFAKYVHLGQMAGLLSMVALSVAVSLPVGILIHLYLELPLLQALAKKKVPWSLHSADAY
jgi:exopolysaccharide production protein ExoZ